jgi:ABC-2 type transport system permease protein
VRGSLWAELLKLGKRPATWLVGIVFVAIGLLSYAFPYFAYRSGRALEGERSSQELLRSALPASLVPSALGAYALLGGAVVLVLGALITGSEYGWGTLKSILSQRTGRTAVLAGKVAATGLVALAMVTVSFGLDALAGRAIAATEHLPADWPSLLDVLRGLAAGWLVVMMWCVVGMFLGVVLRGTAMPIGIGVVWVLVVEQLFRSWLAPTLAVADVAQRWLPGTNAGSLVFAMGTHAEAQGRGTPGVNDLVGGTQATIVVAAYVVVLIAISAAVLRRRDVT